jgi:hypothetical protein
MSTSSIPTSHWRVAAAFSAAHVVLMITGFAISGGGALIEEGTDGITRAFVGADLTPILGGWLVESVAFLLLIPVVVFLAKAIGHTPAGRWAARVGLVSAALYVGSTLAVGLPAGAAAAYGVQQGLDLEAAAAINSLRVFAYFLSLLCLGAHTLSVAICALTDRFHRRWVGILGLVTGAGLVLAPPLAAVAMQDIPTLIWLVWWVGLTVVLARHRPGTMTHESTRTTAIPADIRQA